MNSHFLWPKPKTQYRKYFFGKNICAADVEATVEAFFPSTFPILFSSARAGLSAILQLLKITRPDIVWCPPYSSHCVLESIARFGTPSTTDIKHAKVALIYHQWGFVHTHEYRSDMLVIEDAVDTFFLPKTSPFAINGNFVLWSLPKVIATRYGGVVFCRNKEDAKGLCIIRSARYKMGNPQAVLRMMSDYSSMANSYWHGNESMNGGLPTFALRQIQEHLTHIPVVAEERTNIINTINKYIEFPSYKGRLPSNIPIKPSPTVDKYWGGQHIFNAGLRSMNLACDFSKNAWAKVAPLPVHQNISESVINSLLLEQLSGVFE